MSEERTGWVTFACVLLLITGALNVIYGIAAIGNSNFFAQNPHFVFSNLNTWGWVSLVIGLIEVLAAGSLWRGGLFGRVLAICVAGLNAMVALLSMPASPFWSLVVFALSIVIIEQVSTQGRTGGHLSSAMTGMADYKQ